MAENGDFSFPEGNGTARNGLAKIQTQKKQILIGHDDTSLPVKAQTIDELPHSLEKMKSAHTTPNIEMYENKPLDKGFDNGEEMSNNSGVDQSLPSNSQRELRGMKKETAMTLLAGGMGIASDTNKRLFQSVDRYCDVVHKVSDFGSTLEKKMSRFRSLETIHEAEKMEMFQEVVESFHSIYKPLKVFIEELKRCHTDIDSNMKSLDACQKGSKFATCIGISGSIILVATAAPHIASVLGLAASLPAVSFMTWMGEAWDKHKSTFEWQKDIIVAMEKNTTDIIENMHYVWVCVHDLRSMVLLNNHLSLEEKVILDNEFLEDLRLHIAESRDHFNKAKSLVDRVIKHPK